MILSSGSRAALWAQAPSSKPNAFDPAEACAREAGQACGRPAGNATAKQLVEGQQQQLSQQSQQINELKSAVQQLVNATTQATGAAQKAQTGLAEAQTTAAQAQQSAMDAQRSSDAAASHALEVKTALAVVDAKTNDENRQLGALEGLASRFRFSADVRVRGESYLQSTVPDRNRARIRVRFGVDGQLNEDFIAGFALATGSIGDPSSTNET